MEKGKWKKTKYWKKCHVCYHHAKNPLCVKCVKHTWLLKHLTAQKKNTTWKLQTITSNKLNQFLSSLTILQIRKTVRYMLTFYIIWELLGRNSPISSTACEISRIKEMWKDRGAAARMKHLVKFKKRSLAKIFKNTSFRLFALQPSTGKMIKR